MELPLPIAGLLRRARNAKSPKERHDTAYFAWEASLRLAVAARPPADPTALVIPATGHWVGAFEASAALHDRPPLLAALAIFSEVGLGKKSTPRAVTAKGLLEPLAAYRNQVIGHGSTRAADFYDRAAGALLDGLEAAWASGVFWPTDARLVFLDSIEIDPAGARRARTLALSGLAPELQGSPGEGGGVAALVPADVLPRRLYVHVGGRLVPLHPWLLYQESELRERVLFFNGRKRTAEFLDYLSGEPLRGKGLADGFASIEADLDALFRARAVPAGEEPEGEDPALFGDYRILGKLGQGGMGVVHLARQESLGRLVALKMLPVDAARDAVALARFRREIAALSRCDHPNVVKILASGEVRERPYYAMELIEGPDLSEVAKSLSRVDDFDAAVSTASERLRQARADVFASVPDVAKARAPGGAEPGGRGRDRYRRLASIFHDAALGLHHLHEAGIVHRDVKPGNLMVTAVDHRVVVMDLGLAAMGDTSRTITREGTSLLGTLRYMPPEQLTRNLTQVDRRADVYALGASLYELLTNRPFFDGDSEARLVEQVLRDSPVPPERANPRLPRDLATIVTKATEKDPRLRYDTAQALANDLQAFHDGRPVAARPPALGYVFRLAVARNKPLSATVALALLLAIAGAALFLAREAGLRRKAEDERERATVERERAETERTRAEAREREATRNLARALVEKGERAWAEKDVLGASSLFAAATGLDATITGARQALFEAGGLARVAGRAASRHLGHDAALSPDGRQFAKCSESSMLVGDVETAGVIFSLPGAAGERSAQWSPDGRRLATVGEGGAVRIFDLASRRAILGLSADDSHAEVAFSADGRRFASGFGKISVVDLETGQEVRALRTAENSCNALALSPDGRRVAAGSVKLIQLWDVDSAARATEISGHEGDIMELAFSPEGRRLASGGTDRTVRLWDIESGRETLVLRDHTDSIRSIAFSPDGRRLVSACQDDLVRLWDTRTGELLLVLRGLQGVHSVRFGAEGRRVAAIDRGGEIRVWETVPEGTALRLPVGDEAVETIVLSPDGRRLACHSYNQRVLRLWDVEAGGEPAILRHDGFVGIPAFSPDGRFVATTDWREIRLWPIGGGAEPRVFRAEGVRDPLCFSPDGRRLAAPSSGFVSVFDLSAQEPLSMTLRATYDPARAEFTPDGHRIAVTSADRGTGGSAALQVWDLDAGREQFAFRGQDLDSGVDSLAFASIGNRLAWVDRAGVVRLRSLETAEEVVLAQGEGSRHGFGAPAFSPDGRQLAGRGWSDVFSERVLEGSVQLWQVEAPHHPRTFAVLAPYHWSAVFHGPLFFRPDGLRLAGGVNGLQAWDVESGEEVFALRRDVDRVAFSSDGRRLAVWGASDRTVRVLDVPALERHFAATPAALIAETERRTGLRVEGLEVVPIPPADQDE